MKALKEVVSQGEARKKLLEGVNILADAVGSTLGPLGRNVAINNPHVTPIVLHDGVSVARGIDLQDHFADMGASLLRNAAIKTNEGAGDGTTTSTILAQSIVNEAVKLVEAGHNPMRIKKGIEDDLANILPELEKLSQEVKTDKEKENVATISSSNPELGKIVAGAFIKLGKDAIITPEDGNFETEVEYKTGFEIDRGYVAPHFVTNHETEEAILENPYILMTDKRIQYNHDLIPFLDRLVKETGSKTLLIIAGEVIDEALASLIVNKMKGNIEVVVIQAPAYGGRRLDELDDIKALVGGMVITNDSGETIEKTPIIALGRAEKIIADRDKTIIIGGKGDQKEVEKRIDDLQKQITIANTDYDRDIKTNRLGNLAGKVAIIKVGATTEVEMKEKKERVIDAVNATKAAIEGGIVAGGEITLYTLSQYATGLLKDALKAPFKKLLDNAGLEYAEVLQSLAGKEYPYGIDVMDGKVKDMIKVGIIDPTKVTKSALENACSIASMIVTTSTLVSESYEEK